MKRFLWFGLVLFLVIIAVSGCGGNNGPVSADPPSGTGYRVGLRASSQTIVSGSSVLLTAWVYGPDGNLVMADEAGITFSANLIGSFDNNGKGAIVDGTAVSNFDWVDDSPPENAAPSRVFKITAAYHGAITSIELTAVSKTF